MNRFESIDISDYIHGFTLNIRDKEIIIPFKTVPGALDAISFRMLPTNMIPFIPATISPGLASKYDDYLEHPEDAFNEYINKGATKLIGELKHMGSNAIIIVFKNKEVAVEYTNQEKDVIIYSRTGIQFFRDENEKIITERIRNIFNEVNYFEKFNTNFVIMGTEILPWNAKGSGLLFDQYLPVLDSSLVLNKKIQENIKDIPVIRKDMINENNKTLENIYKYKKQLENYCWDTDINSITIAPFHLLAHEGKTFFNETHKFHLEHFKVLTNANDKLFIDTPYVEIDLNDENSKKEAIKFWEHYTSIGYEGMMLKTNKFIETNSDGDLILPMMKVRGKDYLRIIYGIDYDKPQNLIRLKNRHTSKKRALHIKETLLGIEALNKFVNKDPFKEWHKYVFAILCLTSEVTDPRL